MPDVKQYKIKKNHAISRPVRMLFLDTETKHVDKETSEYHRMDIAWSCFKHNRSDRQKHTEEWLFWNNTKKLCEYIESKTYDKTSLYIFAHNIFFDLQVSDFFYYFTKWGWQLDFIYDKGLTYILVIRYGNKTIKCISTTNYFPHSLKALGEMLNLPKLDVDFKKSTREEIIEYCKRDVEITVAAIEEYIKFIDHHDLGAFRMSRAGQAFGAYRHRFMPNSICTHRDKDIDEFERKAYFGGRVECFEIGELKNGPFVSLDINSMYPYVMKTFRYPTRYNCTVKHPDDDHLKHLINKCCLLGEVKLETKEPCYPLHKDGKLIFPVGRFTTHLCTHGIRYAYNHGHIKEIPKLLVYDKDWIFQSYVDYFYPLKSLYQQNKNKIMERISKDFLNSLYGKFGQKRDLVENIESIDYDGYMREEIVDLVTGKIETVTQLLNKRIITYGQESTNTSMVAIAAHVTEYSRFLLWGMIKKVGLNNMIYCDTDSIKIRLKHINKLREDIDDKLLGKLKNEGVFNEFNVYGAKHYSTEQDIKLKGVPKNAKKLNRDEILLFFADSNITAEDIDEMVGYTYKYKQFLRQPTHLRLGLNRHVKIVDTVKVARPKYNKGRVLKSGKVKPFKILEF